MCDGCTPKAKSYLESWKDIPQGGLGSPELSCCTSVTFHWGYINSHICQNMKQSEVVQKFWMKINIILHSWFCFANHLCWTVVINVIIRLKTLELNVKKYKPSTLPFCPKSIWFMQPPLKIPKHPARVGIIKCHWIGFLITFQTVLPFSVFQLNGNTLSWFFLHFSEPE